MQQQFEKLIKKTFTLASKGEGKVSPNPLVGAVVARGNKILAEGYHRQFGCPHAEIEALNNLKGKAKGLDLYVNLEPCVHRGQTGPCSQAIIEAGIKRVIIANKDPNPLVNGKGIAALKKAGIEVISGVLAKEGKELNRIFFKYISKNIPYVTLKVAMTVNGKIAAKRGEQTWLTSKAAKDYVHQLRAEQDAVLVGSATVLADKPQLNVRHGDTAKHPKRVILDADKLLKDKKQILPTTGGQQIIFSENLPLVNILKELAKKNIASLLVEGGQQVFTSFLREGLVDRLLIFIAPKFIAGNGLDWVDERLVGAPAMLDNWQIIKSREIGNDLLLELRPKENN